MKSQPQSRIGLRPSNSKLPALDYRRVLMKVELSSQTLSTKLSSFSISGIHLHQVVDKAEENLKSIQNYGFTLHQP